jgi:hypothetical protein
MITQQILTAQKSAKAQATQQVGQHMSAATNGFVDLLSNAGSALTDLSQDKANGIRAAVAANGNDARKNDKKNDPDVTPYIQAQQVPPAPVLPAALSGNGLNALTHDNPVLPAAAAADTAIAAAEALLGGKSTTASKGADAAGADAGTNPNANATILGADALNARIAAGAPALTAQTNAAMSASSAHLLQAQDPHDQFGPGTPEVPGAEAVKAATPLPAQPPANLAPPSDLQASLTHPQPTAASGSFAGGSADTMADQQKNDDKSDGDMSGTTSTSLLAPPSTTAAPSAPAQAAAVVQTTAPYVPVGEQIAANVKQAFANNNNEIRIELKPASLGAIDVKLKFGHDGHVTAVITADRSDTLNMLKQDQGNLQQSLRDAGINADSGSLSFNLRGDAQSFAQNSSGGNGQPGSRSHQGGDDSSLTANAAPTSRAHSGSLNIEV